MVVMFSTRLVKGYVRLHLLFPLILIAIVLPFTSPLTPIKL